MESTRFRIESASSEREINNGYQQTNTKQWVWCPDPTLVCVPGVIVATGRDNVLIVHTEDGEERQLDHDEALPVGLDTNVSVHDLAELSLIPRKKGDERTSLSDQILQNLHSRHEAQALEYALLYTLRTRFREENIYTECGSSVLISVNPHLALPIYGPDQIQAYRHRQMLHEMPPHLYGLAENAMHALQESGEDQAIILLGERGSGKSTAAKLLLQYLCHQQNSTSVTSRSKSRSNASDMGPPSTNVHVPIEEQMLHATTVLETFGHMATTNLPNTTGVVKIFSVDYDTHGRLLAGNLTIHSLQKHKVISATERNFHIFHYVLAEAAVNPSFRDSLELNYSFNIAPGPIVRSEARQYQDLVASLTALRVPAHHVQNIMRVIAALLHLGNVKFVPAAAHLNENTQDAACMIQEATSHHLQLAANLMEVEASVLDHYFRTRKMVASNQTSSLKIVSVHQATRARDTFCKNLYESLLNAIVFRMNASLRSKLERYEKSNIMVENRGIHILDAFGFTPADNEQGFDALCENYWAEKLRSFYLASTFPTATNVDPDMYVRLYEQSPVGIFPVLAEQMSSRNRQAHDAHFVNKLLVANESINNQLLQPVLPSATNKKNYKVQFTVQHGYGQTITYEADDILRRNNKSVSTTAAAILKSSKNSFVKGMVDRHGNSPTMPASTYQGNVRIATNFNSIKQAHSSDNVTMELMQQTSAILTNMQSMGHYFVYCIDPRKEDQLFHSRDVVRQLRSFDILNLVVSCQRNLTVKLSPSLFFSRYKNICGHRQTLESLIRSLIAIGVMDDLTWRVEGVPPQYVWLHVLQRKKLEKARELYLNACATMIQRNLQRSAFRKICLRRLEALSTLRNAVKTRDPKLIQSSLQDASSWMEENGKKIRVIQEAAQVMSQVAEESYLKSILADALTSNHSVILTHVIHTAKSICPSWKHELLTTATQVLKDGPNKLNTQSNQPLRDALLSGSVASMDCNSFPDSPEGVLALAQWTSSIEANKARKEFSNCFHESNVSVSTWSNAITKMLETGLIDETLGKLSSEWNAWENLRTFIPMSRQHIEETLDKAVDLKCLPAIEICLTMLTEMGANNDELVLKAVALLDEKLSPAKERPQAVAFVELALQSESPILLEAAMLKCRSVGMAQWDMNVRKLEKALENNKKEKIELEETWKAFLNQEYDIVLSMEKKNNFNSPCFNYLKIIQNIKKKLNEIKNKNSIEKRLKEAASFGLLNNFKMDLKNYFNILDQSIQISDMEKTISFIKNRLELRLEIRQDILTLLTTQTQLVLARDNQQPPGLMEEAGLLTKKLQKILILKIKLNKILKSPNENELKIWLNETKTLQVELNAIQQAQDALSLLEATTCLETIEINEKINPMPQIELNLIDYPGLERNGNIFQWENRILDSSLLKNQPTQWSLHINRCILGYMRDRIVLFREMLAQSILKLGLKNISLVDEIFLQILKQLINNPKPESERRGWSLLALCLSCYLPSNELKPFMKSFFKNSSHFISFFCSTRLDSQVIQKGFLPNLNEIQSFELRSPFLATIQLIDGTIITKNFPISPDLIVSNLVDVCAHFLGLQEGSALLLGLSKEIDTPLYHPQAYLGDIYDTFDSKLKIIFILKIRLYPIDIIIENEILKRLLYLQAMEDILQGYLPLIQIEPVIRLASYGILADTEIIPFQKILNTIEYIPNGWKNKKKMDEFNNLIFNYINTILNQGKNKKPEEWEILYLNEVQKHRLYGCHFFNIFPIDIKKPVATTPNLIDSFDSLIFGINGMGIHFVDKNHNILFSWEHSDIIGIILKFNQFIIQTNNSHIHASSPYTLEIGRLLEDYSKLTKNLKQRIHWNN